MTLVAELAAPVERVWDAYTDPRQLERFWGPPGWPATFTAFDHTVGGRAPTTDDRSAGRAVPRARGSSSQIDGPARFEVLDAFADEDGTVRTPTCPRCA